MAKTYTTDEVRQVFLDRGVTPLFNEYKGAHGKLRFRCSCPEGLEGEISWANLYMRKLPDGSDPVPRCPACVRAFKRQVAKRPEVQRGLEARNVHSTESVQTLFRDRGATALLGEYVSLDSPIPFRCACGHGGKASLSSVLDAVRRNPDHRIRCRSCITKGVRESKPDEMTSKVKIYIQKFGATPLFDKFPGLYAPLRFRCKCGKEHQTTWDSLKDGVQARCPDCREADRPRGETHPNWNPDLTDEDRAKWETVRAGWQMQRWYAEVKRVAGYTCALSGQVGGELASHHIAWVSRHPERMYDLDNGVCIAQWLHFLFHRLYPRSVADEVAAWGEFCARYRAGEFAWVEQEPAA